MSESLQVLVDEISAAEEDVRCAVSDRRWGAANDALRRMLSAASKLHMRTRVIDELTEETARATAEVDRALARAEQHHQTTVDEQLAEIAREKKAPRKPTTPRGKKGS